jgi:hypothetical protein
MSLLRMVLLALFFSGCATGPEFLRSKYSLSEDQKIIDVPFIAQSDYHCGPATLAMIANHLGKSLEISELSKMLYTPKAEGTFQNDLLAASRRLGLIAVPITEIKTVFREISNGHPILIFQNLGLSWIPKWHYALVVGYDLKENVMILHSGTIKNFKLKISTFESTWRRADNWGLLIENPGFIPETATEIDMVETSAGLEKSGTLNAAKISYEKILEKWPHSLGTLIGLGNINFAFKDYHKAKTYLKNATSYHPKAAGAWHNYAIVLTALKQIDEARIAAKKAILLSDQLSEKNYRENLKSLLD